MGIYTSRVVNEIGVQGTPSHYLKDLEVLVALLKKDFPSLDLSIFTSKVFPEAKKAISEKKKESKLRMGVEDLKKHISSLNVTEQVTKDVVAWLGCNKVFTFIAAVQPGLEAKHFGQTQDGNWRVASVPPGSRLSVYDTLVDVLEGGKNHPVKGLSAKDLTALMQKKGADRLPQLRVYRKTASKRQMYEALRLPPPSIKMTLWDMDLCLLKVHTGGHTNLKLQPLSKEVTEAYCYLMDIMIEKKLTTGVVTFSDKKVAKAIESQYGGEDLVRPLIFHALRRHWMQLDRTLQLQDAINKARSFVENDLYVKGAYPEWRNRNDEEFKKKPMPNSKEWHMAQVAKEFEAKTKQKVKPEEMILFDDGERNIREAERQGVVGVWVNEETGFTVQDWEEAMNEAWTA
mmetsp:Transcript_755/g.1459  ORF Transcript_755/g.1459 Transcript_755/m.1459 type:complete len:401 (+) Transcript_755:42-1244(+)